MVSDKSLNYLHSQPPALEYDHNLIGFIASPESLTSTYSPRDKAVTPHGSINSFLHELDLPPKTKHYSMGGILLAMQQQQELCLALGIAILGFWYLMLEVVEVFGRRSAVISLSDCCFYPSHTDVTAIAAVGSDNCKKKFEVEGGW
ncbi:uncharacterized protein A4U43_C04F19750 [Asparagus officinalis]|uniref:Uncharacterized protein n=1 Tax=Asparagus officinalis TaxID=4686 RepID=A0A5P1F289_ASPOF|nr:uncharacterized protein A4U43_C04F19750 [Asparagus officinalis]